MRGRLTKRKAASLIALALCLLLSPTGLVPTAQGQQQPQKRYRAGSGVFRVGENQAVLLTLIGGEGDDTFHTRDGEPDALHAEVTTITYAVSECPGDGVCKLVMASQRTFGPTTLMPGEAITTRIEYDPAVEAFSLNVLSNSQNVQANVLIVDKVTGKVVSAGALEILLDMVLTRNVDERDEE